MTIDEEIARARELSDAALLASLQGVVGASRRMLAVVLAHLGEVEGRRLHVRAGYGSMFAYCTARLGMSEDEACRRIAVARLARRFPAVFQRLADGRISLSVASLLEPSLTEANHLERLDAVSGMTVGRAREVLAAWSPRPDVMTTIRKLPERRPLPARLAHANAESSSKQPRPPLTASDDRTDAPRQPSANSPLPATPPPLRANTTSNLRSIEPLSPGRYKVQFTADAELKHKLELARDLLRHAIPSGDIATIVGRALDLLIDKTKQRRFANTNRPKAAATIPSPTAPPPPAPSPPDASDSSYTQPRNDPTATTPPTSTPEPSPSQSPPSPQSPQQSPSPKTSSRHIPNAVRRTVLARDGLRCTWRAPDGTRCESQAWLEHDHIQPRAQGGSHAAFNIRIVCHAHNELAAEEAYGRHTIQRIIKRRRAQPPPEPDPPS